MNRLLRRVPPAELDRSIREPVDRETLAVAEAIVDDVRQSGEAAVRVHAERLGDLAAGQPLVRKPGEMAAALAGLDGELRGLLERTAGRIGGFARAQRAALNDLDTAVPGGRAGHRAIPVGRAGCYAPGGRFPLVSSVLMTVVTAREAGVGEVWLATPRPSQTMLAAAAVAGADGLLAVGGAQAVAALAYGAGPVPACDVIVGPGNRFVTAAKKLVSGRVGIDMLAGPSELAVLADDTADPAVIAADLLAQAEHDPDAVPVLITWRAALVGEVERELERQLGGLPTAGTARAALAANGLAVVAGTPEEAVEAAVRFAPEHLELMVAEPDRLLPGLTVCGAVFIGHASAEVFGDYGAGPNHVLPTGGTARHAGGLSVLTFLRVGSWLKLDPGPAGDGLRRDAALLARLEGLEAHARAAERRG